MYKIISSEINGYEILWYDSLTSTNDKATELALKNACEGTVVIADFQTKGKGQRQNTWEGEKGKNLTFSLLISPAFLPAEQQFMLSKISSLSVCDYLNSIGIKASIKWPNDVYIDDCKVSGMLIENSIIGQNISFSIVGIGINFNQKSFSKNVLNPISVFQKTGKETNIFEALNSLLHYFDKWYKILKSGEVATINNTYQKSLYRAKGFHLYESKGKSFKAQFVGISDIGELILKDENGAISYFAFKEVNYII